MAKRMVSLQAFPSSLARGLAPYFPSPSLSNACHAGYINNVEKLHAGAGRIVYVNV